ncbi:MAG: hypothetical protein WAO08_33230 [Hyphomicrobiaceae bacterium]
MTMHGDDALGAFDEDTLRVAAQAAFRSGELPIEYPNFLSEPVYIDKNRFGDAFAEPQTWGVESKSDSNLLVTHDQRRYQMEILKLADMKWQLLWAVYGIKPGDWEGLARALIAQHVPGFKITTSLPKPCRRRGAPPRRHPFAIVGAVAAKQAELKSKNRAAQLTDACNAIHAKWPPELGKKPQTAKALETRYYQCRKKLDEWNKIPSLADMATCGPTTKNDGELL